MVCSNRFTSTILLVISSFVVLTWWARSLLLAVLSATILRAATRFSVAVSLAIKTDDVFSISIANWCCKWPMLSSCCWILPSSSNSALALLVLLASRVSFKESVQEVARAKEFSSLVLVSLRALSLLTVVLWWLSTSSIAASWTTLSSSFFALSSSSSFIKSSMVVWSLDWIFVAFPSSFFIAMFSVLTLWTSVEAIFFTWLISSPMAKASRFRRTSSSWGCSGSSSSELSSEQSDSATRLLVAEGAVVVWTGRGEVTNSVVVSSIGAEGSTRDSSSFRPHLKKSLIFFHFLGFLLWSAADEVVLAGDFSLFENSLKAISTNVLL